jgi:hypothetical protein
VDLMLSLHLGNVPVTLKLTCLLNNDCPGVNDRTKNALGFFSFFFFFIMEFKERLAVNFVSKREK